VATLQLLAHLSEQLNLFLIAETLAPVTTETESPAMNPHNSSFWPLLTPTHTFADDLDLDVLLIPGGPGIRAENVTAITDFIKKTYPKVQYLITVCTGAGLAAKAGVLDGKRATTNKRAWGQITPMGPKVKWVSPARWVVDGNIWTSSGVSFLYLFSQALYVLR
jgi:transcriptional regulator GlxA family with amidase domain